MTVAILLLGCCPWPAAGQQQAPANDTTAPLPPGISRTMTLPPEGGAALLYTTEYSRLQFRSAYLYPPTRVVVHIVNNTLVAPIPPICLAVLREGMFVAVDVASSGSTIPGRSRIDVVARDTAAPTPSTSVQWDPSLIEKIDFPNASAIDIQIRGRFGYDLPSKQAFQVRIPSTCVESMSDPEPALFTVEAGRRSGLGRIYTFVYLVAGVFGVLALLGGSLSALVPVQLAAIVTSCGCGPLDLQEEFSVLQWTLVPFHLPSWEVDDHADFNLLFGSLILILVAAFAEGIHFIVVMRARPTYLEHARKAFSIKKSPHGLETRDRDGRRWEHRTLLPPYVAMCLLVALVPGLVRYGVRSVLREEDSFRLLAAFVCVAGSLFLLPVVILGISRNKAMGYVTYQASKGRIPRWLQPSGAWGCNVFRLTIGVLFEDFKRGRRTIGAITILYCSLIAALAGSKPRSVDACRNQQYIFAIASAAYTAMLYALKPYRSIMASYGHVASHGTFTLFLIMYLARAGYYTDVREETHWSNVAMYAFGIINGVVAGVVSVSHIVVAVWEARDGTAFRSVNGEIGRITGGEELSILARQLSASPDGAGGGKPDFASSDPERSAATANAAGSDDDGDAAGAAAAAAEDGSSSPTKRRKTGRQGMPNFDDMGVAIPPGMDPDTAVMYRDMVRWFTENPVDEVDQAAVHDSSRRGPRSLADYLLEDFDSLPPETRGEMVLWERLARNRRDDEHRLRGSSSGRMLAATRAGGVRTMLDPINVKPEDLQVRPQPLRQRPPVNMDLL